MQLLEPHQFTKGFSQFIEWGFMTIFGVNWPKESGSDVSVVWGRCNCWSQFDKGVWQ